MLLLSSQSCITKHTQLQVQFQRRKIVLFDLKIDLLFEDGEIILHRLHTPVPCIDCGCPETCNTFIIIVIIVRNRIPCNSLEQAKRKRKTK